MDLSQNPPFMFTAKKIDYFFRWRWWSAPLIFVPISLALLLYALYESLSVVELISSFLIGGLFWTLFEYVMHRFVFHLKGKTPLMKHIHYVVHGMHHAHTTDPLRVIFPPFLSIINGLLVGLILAWLLPLPWAAGIFSSFILSYTWYEFIHYADHHIKWKVSWLKRLKRHHLLHHHSGAYQGKNFGVTTSLWDRVFNTYLA